ncbi:metallophosphoesterase [Candidatus Woesearchaeota archaeon]|nr:metallophosphoesterase [Candidatus Woesearchaeota archaeon]
MTSKLYKSVKVAHISDLHFGWFSGISEDKIHACRKSIIEFDPDVVVATGDIGFFGGDWEFKKARKFFDSLPFEKLVVPGNHDVLDGFMIPKINPFRKLRSFHRNLPYRDEITLGRLHIVGLDSTTFFALGRGHVDIDEFDRFSEDKNMIKCIAMHHHVIAIPGTGEFNMLSNVDKVIGELIKHNIQYVFHGHRHKRMHFRLDSFVWDKCLNNPVDIFTCGTTLAGRKRGGDPYNNYNRVIINTQTNHNSFSCVNMIYQPKLKQFVPRDSGFKI